MTARRRPGPVRRALGRRPRASAATLVAALALAAPSPAAAEGAPFPETPILTTPLRAPGTQLQAQAQTQPQQVPAPSLAPAPAQSPTQAPAAPPQAQPAPPATSQLRGAPRSPVLIVNRQAVLENSAAAQALQATERETLERVTAELERVKQQLQAEEQELTRIKGVVPAAEFDARARDFDRRVRAERAAGQDRRAVFQKFTTEARQALASALPRVLEALRRETGALVILDSAAVAAADPALDVTQLAIQRYDAETGDVRFDPPEELMPR